MKIILPLLLALTTITVTAHDIKLDGIFYNLNTESKEATVTYCGQMASSYIDEYSGSVIIPSTITVDGTTYSVTKIGWSAFEYCDDLTSITIPNSVKEIGSDAFNRCGRLNAVHISDIAAWCEMSFRTTSFTKVSTPLFYANLYLNDELVTDLIIPNSVTSIGDWAFGDCKSLTSVTIPNSVTSIGDYAFRGCSCLTSVTIGNSVATIGDYAFKYCDNLTSITIPNSVTTIGSEAFYNCKKLTSVTIPNSVTYIGYSAFSGCSGVTTVTLGNSVRNIESQAFQLCGNLKTVTCYAEKVPSAATDAFNAIILERLTLYVPAISLQFYELYSPWSHFGTILPIDENASIATSALESENPHLYSLEGKPITTPSPNNLVILKRGNKSLKTLIK